MTASRPDNEAIFHAARDIPDPDRRREYVREACGHDEARTARVLDGGTVGQTFLSAERVAGRLDGGTVGQTL